MKQRKIIKQEKPPKQHNWRLTLECGHVQYKARFTRAKLLACSDCAKETRKGKSE